MNFIENHSFSSPLFLKIDENSIRCVACQRKCSISIDKAGYCKVRFNKNGKLMVPYGYVSSLNIDPVEKKPVYHFIPGSKTISFGMLGCNFKCIYCQNFEISQSFFIKNMENIQPKVVTSDYIIEIAIKNNVKLIVSTYNEPTISIEWACEIFKKAKENIKNAKTGIVSNGYLSHETIEYIKDCVDFIRVDLKSFDSDKFKMLTQADLKLLIESIENIYKKGFHLEIVTLIINGFNDSLKEIKEMALFIKSLSQDIPWHLTRFHPDYKMINIKETDITKIEELINHAMSLGLNYVYGGNYNTNYTDTLCPQCKEKIFKRGYMSLINANISKGKCPKCGFKIYGVYD